MTEDSDKVATFPVEEQKQEIRKRFDDLGWETTRVLEELSGEAGKTFYAAESAQAKSKSLVKNRVALLGDAGYCPVSTLTLEKFPGAFVESFARTKL